MAKGQKKAQLIPAAADGGVHEPPSYVQDTYERATAAYINGNPRGLIPPSTLPVSFSDYQFPIEMLWESTEVAPIEDAIQKLSDRRLAFSVPHLKALIGDRPTSRIDRAGNFHDFGLVDLAKFFYDRRMSTEVEQANALATKLVGEFVKNSRTFLQKNESIEEFRLLKVETESQYLRLLERAQAIVEEEIQKERSPS